MFPGHTTTFASYPGMLYSSDDFALMSSGLAGIETTIAVWDSSLFDKVQAKGQVRLYPRLILSAKIPPAPLLG